MRSQDDTDTAGAGRPLWTIPLAMVLASLLAVATGMLWSLAADRTPRPTTAIEIAGTGLLQQRGDGPIVLCVGADPDTTPAVCGATVAVTGVRWDQVPRTVRGADTVEGWASLTGWWTGTVLEVATVEEPQVVTPSPIAALPDQLCADPGGSDPVGAQGAGPDPRLLEHLPGFQGHWVTEHSSGADGGVAVTVHNVAVLGDLAEAERRIRDRYDGPLCVGAIPGMARTEVDAGIARLTPGFADLRVVEARPSLTGGSAGLAVQVFVATPEVRQQLDQLLGPEVSRWATVYAQFRIVS